MNNRICRLTGFTVFIALLFLSVGHTGVIAESPQSGYDARLTDYAYPFPVSYYQFESQRQQLEMAYMDVKPQDGSHRGVVLLLHGKNFSGAYWARTIDSLTSAGYRVVAPDQIGFGKSSKPEYFQFSFHTLATFTKHLLGDIGVKNVSVVGHSMGGMLATRFTLMFPEITNRLILVNPIGLEDWKRKVPYQTVSDWYAGELNKTPEAIKAYMRKSYFDGEWKNRYDPLVEIQAGWTRGPDYQRIAWVSALTYDMIFTQPVLYEFGDIRVPTMLIIGQRDRTALGTDLVSPSVAETMGNYPELGRSAAEAIPDARLVEMESIGHIPHYERFSEYYDALTDFLRDE